jgi:heme/copper-type cytochrome/quinol oxidase subunit 3
MGRDVLEAGMTRDELLALKNKRTGLAIFQVSWIMVFVCLVAANWFIRGSSPSWPPPGVPRPDAILPTVVTLALIASSFLVRNAVRDLKAGKAFAREWGLALGLGALFVVVMLFEFATAVQAPGPYRDTFRTMIGYHAVHAIVIGYMMWRVYRGAKQYSPTHFWTVEGTAGLWYFVTVAWLLFYLVLYLV